MNIRPIVTATVAADSRHRLITLLFGLQAAEKNFRLTHAEVAGALVPEYCCRDVGANPAEVRLFKKMRVIALPQSQCCLPVTSIGGTLIKKPRRCDIAGSEQRVATHQ